MRFVEALATTILFVAATATTLARDDLARGVAAQGPGAAGHQPQGRAADVLFSNSDESAAPARGVVPHSERAPDGVKRMTPPQAVTGQQGASAGRTAPQQVVLRSAPAARRLALEPPGQSPAQEQPRPSGWLDVKAGKSISTMLGGLAIVLGVFLLFAWTVRKRMPRGSGRLPDEIIEVLGRTTLAAKQSLHLVRVGGKLIVVSVTASGTETLTEITDPVEVTRILAACQQHTAHSSTTAFRQVFEQLGREPANGFLGSQAGRAPFTREGTGAV